MAFSLQFLGAAGTVTGSKYLLTCNDKKILIDCGLFQGIKSLRLKNWDGFPVDAAEIDAIVLTHAHIDHSGFIPRLIKKGFRGKIYSTAATREVCALLLPDCGYLQEEEAEYLNKKGRTKHKPAFPLFTCKEGQEAIQYFVDVPFNKSISISPELSFKFQYAGHILGAASVIVTANNSKIAFTGDIGRKEDPILFEPDPLPGIDYLVTESTYGNRPHKATDPQDDLAAIINETCQKDGVIIIPAFAVGRAQTLMYYILQLRKQNRIPHIPMYLNSPMAAEFSSIFLKYKQLHKLSQEECIQIQKLVTTVKTVDESIALNERKGPMLIISASGMLTGGRVLHHIKAFAPFAQNTILLSGFQAAGTRGDALLRGADEIKIHGEYVPVNAQIKELDNISAHADYFEIIDWFKQSQVQPKEVFITHGEPAAADELRRRLTETFNWSCVVPEQMQTFQLE